MDDFYLKNSGKRTIRNNSRYENIKFDYSNREDSFLFHRSYFGNRFYSQKGGKEEQNAGKYAEHGFLSPELGLIKKHDFIEGMILFSPIISYREKFNLQKEVNKDFDFEFIISLHKKISPLITGIEAGRGYQRLDSYGLLFNGYSNFIQIYWGIDKIRFSLQELKFNYKNGTMSFNEDRRNSSLYGGSVSGNELAFIKSFHIFYYKYNEPLIISEKQSYGEKQGFQPFGDMNYSGFEYRTINSADKINLEGGAIRIQGYRNYAEYSTGQYKSKKEIKAFAFYQFINYQINSVLIKLGGLYASKSKDSFLNSEQGGYSSVSSRPSIFGGYGSFLLSESVYLKHARPFRGEEESIKPGYNSRGMQMMGIAAEIPISSFFQTNIYINRSYSELGIGSEFVLMGILNGRGSERNAFLILSACTALVNPVTPEKVVVDEIRKTPALQEFNRFFISAGFQF